MTDSLNDIIEILVDNPNPLIVDLQRLGAALKLNGWNQHWLECLINAERYIRQREADRYNTGIEQLSNIPDDQREMLVDSVKSILFAHLPDNTTAGQAQKLLAELLPYLRSPMREACPVCNGNDSNAPCAYPQDAKLGCLRDKRLERESVEEAGWYINEKGEKISLCSALDAIEFGLKYFEDDNIALYDFLLEWSHGTIEELQTEFSEWKRTKIEGQKP